MKSIIFITLLTGAVYNALSQTHISGKVVNSENNPFSFSTVYWKGTQTGVVTDEEGYYAIKKTGQSDTLTFSLIGYKTQNVNVPASAKTINVMMIEDVGQLDEVTVARRRKNEVISKLEERKIETLTTAPLESLPCCHLAASFENTLSVDKTYTDAVSGTEEIKMPGLAGLYSQILSKEVAIARGLISISGLHIPGAFLSSISISQGVGSVISGYEGITGQIQMFLKQPGNVESIFVNLYGNSFGAVDMDMYRGIQLSEKWNTMILLHGSSHFWKFDDNKDGFIDALTGIARNITQTFKYANKGEYRHQLGYRINCKDAYSRQMGFDKKLIACWDTDSAKLLFKKLEECSFADNYQAQILGAKI